MKNKIKRFQVSSFKFHSKAGFTLIELMVVFTLVLIIGGVGIASFNSYSQQQEVSQTAQYVKQMFEKAKSNALSQVKPPLDPSLGNYCKTLYGYRIKLDFSPPYIASYCITNDSTSPTDYRNSDTENIVIPSSFTPVPPAGCQDILFSTVTYKTTCLNAQSFPLTFTIRKYGIDKVITITNDGTISIN